MSVMDGIRSIMRPNGLDMQDDDFDDEFDDDFDDEFEEDEERSGGFFGGLFSKRKTDDDSFDLDEDDEYDEPEQPKRDVSFRGYNSYKSSEKPERKAPESSSNSAKTAPRGTAVKRQQPQESTNTNTRTGGARVIPMSKTVGSSGSATKISSELYMIKPRSEEDARVAVDELLNGKVVIVNLEGLNIEIAQYVTDFVTGANYSIGGNFSTINNQVLVFAPANVNMTGAFDEGSGDTFNF